MKCLRSNMWNRKKRRHSGCDVCGGLRAILTSPPAPHGSILCGNLLGWLFRAQFAQHGLSGWLRELCDKVAQAGVLPKSGLPFTVVSPRDRHRELPPSRSHSWELDPGLMCSSPWAALVLACQTGRRIYDDSSALFELSLRPGWASPSQTREVLRRWTEKDRKEGHGLRKPPPQLHGGWDMFLSGREAKQGKTKGHVHFFPFVQLKGLIYKSCKPSWLGKIWPYGKVSYCCLGWREYL